MAKPTVDIRSLARAYTEANIKTLAGFANGPEVPPGIRIQAVGMLLDRAWGKAAQPVTGEDGEGPIVVEIIQYAREKRREE